MIKKWVLGFKLIDLFGIGVFFLVLASAFFFLLRKPTYLTFTFSVSEYDALMSSESPAWYLEKLKSGMVQKDLLGRNDIEIVDVYSITSNESRKKVFLSMKVLTAFDKKNHTYSYKGVPILAGSFQKFVINGILIRGIVQNIEDGNNVPKMKKFLIEGYVNPSLTANQDPYVANAISDGINTYLSNKIKKGMFIKDSRGVVITEIKDVIISNSYRKFVDGNRFVEAIDSERKKVRLVLEIMAEDYEGVYLYRQLIPIKVNNNLDLGFWDFNIGFTITDVKELSI